MKKIDQLSIAYVKQVKYSFSLNNYQDIVSNDLIDIIVEKMGGDKSTRDFKLFFLNDLSPGRYCFINNSINIDVSQLKYLSRCKYFAWMNNKLYATLIHEIRHWYQCKQGWLVIDNINRKIIWKGTPYNPPSEGSLDYYNSPWEVDANETSEKITNELINEGLIYPDVKKTINPTDRPDKLSWNYTYKPTIDKKSASTEFDAFTRAVEKLYRDSSPTQREIINEIVGIIKNSNV